ncbi:protein containing PDZ domain, a K-box domain, and a TPR region [Klebsormidium nitens]|uniref:Protein containing PDZ domain, a K-box domain, and a TPR region n=1 Tax=Klebsormidium nitens TaxID=105231 RepID=A0A1Y1IE63_KLENI|nr:protein containing PDZ domain, a K-box domain, and a TPR region [Klebsormidium nitens]|eukprot:GAQ88883.1 protein containing PDZ domain, a K-box domain, and a TPR region [Klebsormidium nitens]
MAATAVCRGVAGTSTFVVSCPVGQQCGQGYSRSGVAGPCHSPTLQRSGPAGAAQSAAAAALRSSSFAGRQVAGKQCRGVATRKLTAGRPGARAAEAKDDEYVVTLEKPVGLNFYRGNDGGTYIDKIQPGGSADATGLFTVGDKVLETSAVFGTEMWGAAEFGRTMYTIKTRVGNVAFKMQKRFGVKQEVAGASDQFVQERRSGNYGEGSKELQRRNYLKQQELKKLRADKIESGLKLYRQGQYEAALVEFETVLGSKPTDREEAVASYNVACCYSKLGNVEAGLDALDSALRAGFDDYKTVREDADLQTLRDSPEFKVIVNKYDEPFINENAVKALTSVFGFLKR